MGGLWDIDAPRSTVYESAHLISSRTTTEFVEHPMPPGTPDYPSHTHLLAYFRSYADRFGLRDGYRFGTEVTSVQPVGDPAAPERWVVRATGPDGIPVESEHAGVVVADGTLSEPNVPELPGHFDGEIFHTAAYKHPQVFAGKRVLVVGAGNSGCDIVVDAVHHAASVDLSVRRGYHFVPSTSSGAPPTPSTRAVRCRRGSSRLSTPGCCGCSPATRPRFGFPEPDHKLYESHPIVNSLILHHLGHGDASVRPDVERLDGDGVVFRDGTRQGYDVVVLATGYRLHYPSSTAPCWPGPRGRGAPGLYLQIASPAAEGLYVVGMVEASGIGWQGRWEQAELVAAYLAARESGAPAAAQLRARVADRAAWPDLSGGYHYLGLERMAYYVNKDAYRRAVRAQAAELEVGR
ncbi:flavin-containing monooxygenase [Ornithinimicrobium avium]|uniref:flavin-containing monooxygenase n=1 Tax=Ornithinimicrobium avium TaxID=2283195 RepID=UPI001E4EF0E0|nr:NAD(P)-binding domain-containing protein [Ornithinimicrobium avium]